MNPPSRPPSSRLPLWIYRHALRLYPAAFRHRHEKEMLEIFRREWSRAAEAGPASASRYGLHLLGDLLATVPSQWASGISPALLLPLAAAVCAVVYLSRESAPMLLKALAVAGCTGAFASFATVVFRRGWAGPFKVAVLGTALGFGLTFALGLIPRLTPAPADPLRPVTDPSLTGPEIYRRMETVYREARTYRDEGRVERTLGNNPRTMVQSFRTAFAQGQGFRFEFGNSFGELDPWQYVIWQDKSESRAKSWRTGAQREDELVWTDPAIDEKRVRAQNALNEMLVRRGQRPVSFEWDRSFPHAKTGTLERALRDTVTISGRTSIFVPLLLQPALTEGVVRVYSAKGIVSSRPNQVIPHGDVILYGIQRIDGVDTFKVELTDGAEPDILWIDVSSYLIRRISRNFTVFGSKPGLRWKETITYHPQLNGPVSAAALAFQPGPELTDWQRWVRLLPGNGGLLLPGNESLLLIVALLATLVALLANRLHRQQLRRRGQEVRESWFIPPRRLTFVGAVGIGAICFGMWLAGVDRADIWRNLLMAPLLQQAFFLLYVMHRRSRDHARLTTAA